MLRPLFALTISACFLGCGGNVVVDHGAAGGHGAGGQNAGGQNAGGQNAGGFGAEGPGPTVGSVVASSGTSVGEAATSSSTGTGTSCPDQVYEDGACQIEGQSCPMDQSCCSGSGVCKGGAWHFTGPLCNMPCRPCGPDDAFACTINALCVAEQPGFTATTYHCAPNPCPPGNAQCNCASQLCDNLTCEGAMQQTVFCDCPAC